MLNKLSHKIKQKKNLISNISKSFITLQFILHAQKCTCTQQHKYSSSYIYSYTGCLTSVVLENEKSGPWHHHLEMELCSIQEEEEEAFYVKLVLHYLFL